VNRLNKGALYPQLRKTIAINILDFNHFETNNFHTVFHLCADNDKELQIDEMEIHFLELPKFRKTMQDYKCSLHNWLLFIDGWSEEEKSMAKKEDPIFELADEALDYVTSNKEVQYLHEQFQKRTLDEKSNLYSAKQEVKIETAKKMLTKGFNIADICEVTGLKEKDFH
jgi:predicted transposase/invertase (TIGR01784 family)